MNSVEDTAQTMFATQTVKGIVQQATSIIINKTIYGNNGKNHNVVAETAQQSVQQKSNNVNELSSNIKLTGQFTDIAYADTDKITEKAISELCKDDEKLLNNVMDTYNNAVNDGLLKREKLASEPTARNSKRLPVKANGDVRLRSVLSIINSGISGISNFMPCLPATVKRSFLSAFSMCSRRSVNCLPRNEEMIAGGASLAPRR